MMHKTLSGAVLSALFFAVLSANANAGVGTFSSAGYGNQSHHSVSVSIGHCSLHAQCVPQNTWVAGQYKQVSQQVWTPGKNVSVWVGPVYQKQCTIFGITFKVLVHPGHYELQCQPGFNQVVLKNVFVPGHWVAGCKPIFTQHFSKLLTAPPAAPSLFGGYFKKGSSFGGYNRSRFGKQSKPKSYGGYAGYGG